MPIEKTVSKHPLESLPERLQTMELLWRSFSGSEDEVPSPDWHGEVLSERLAKVEAGEGKFLSSRPDWHQAAHEKNRCP
jgi:hypothetical protein